MQSFLSVHLLVLAVVCRLLRVLTSSFVAFDQSTQWDWECFNHSGQLWRVHGRQRPCYTGDSLWAIL